MGFLTAVLVFCLLMSVLWVVIGNHSDKKQNKILEKEWQKRTNSLEYHEK